LIQVSQVQLQDSALEFLSRNFGSRGLGDQGLATTSDGENAGCLDVIPFLLEERVSSLFLATFLGSRFKVAVWS